MKTFTEEAKEVRAEFAASFIQERHKLSTRVRADTDTLLIMYDQMVDKLVQSDSHISIATLIKSLPVKLKCRSEPTKDSNPDEKIFEFTYKREYEAFPDPNDPELWGVIDDNGCEQEFFNLKVIFEII